MTSGARVRFVVAAVVIGTLLAGVWLVPGGASTATKKTYSSADCAAIQNMKNPSGSNKSFGAEAKATADAFSTAAGKVSDKSLKKSLKGLASFYRSLGNANSNTAAAVL